MTDDPYRILRAQMEERMKGSACEEIIQFNVIVGREGEPNHAQIIFVINSDKLGVDTEAAAAEAAIEREVDKLKHEMRTAELDQQEAAAKEQLIALQEELAAEDEATRQGLRDTLGLLSDE